MVGDLRAGLPPLGADVALLNRCRKRGCSWEREIQRGAHKGTWGNMWAQPRHPRALPSSLLPPAYPPWALTPGWHCSSDFPGCAVRIRVCMGADARQIEDGTKGWEGPHRASFGAEKALGHLVVTEAGSQLSGRPGQAPRPLTGAGTVP